ncbi:MAG TPA: hypothetical protein DGG94_04315 [Micromonosporaceae bacterium]|nr:hypothetical protein [Micromonosporaceae bacterium]HCU49023.1 hypothetical protein [Micromonosporaceae bacterium]
MTWMRIEDVFTIDGRGPVITGRVQGGPIRPGDQLWLMSDSDPVAAITVVHVGGFCLRGTQADAAGPGDNAGLLIAGVEASQIHIGQVVTDAVPG